MKIDYGDYKFTFREIVMYSTMGAGLIALIAYVFYRSAAAFFLLLPAMYYYMKMKKRELMEKRKKELGMQFREAILAVSTALGAGYSVENSFVEAEKDLRNLYGRHAAITREFSYISGRLSANETLEGILKDLAKRSGIEDIKDFSDVFNTAKKTGGDMVSIIRKSAFHISDKIEVKREIDTLMSSKKMEQNIMNVVPIMIILYVGVNSPGFLDALYHNFVGAAVMTVCLFVYLSAYFMAKKIVSIEV